MVDPAKEHAMLAKVLSATLAPTPSPDLADFVADLESQGAGRQLRVDLVEQVLMAKLSARPLVAERLRYLKDCSQRCDEVRRDAKYPSELLAVLPTVQAMLGNYGALSLSTAELFGADTVPHDQAAAALVAMWEARELPFVFVTKIVEAVEEEHIAPFFSSLLTKACQRLQGRDLTDQRTEDVNFVTNVCATKGPLARLLVTLPIFKPPPAPHGAALAQASMMAAMSGAAGSRQPQPGEGFRLQTESLLGAVLAPTCVDTALHKEKSARQMYFQNLARKTRPAISSSQSLLRHALDQVMSQASGIIDPLLRTDKGTREAVLCWFGSLITGTESRTKSANTLDEGGGPQHFVQSMENSPMPVHQNLDARLQMQLMKARMIGFATSGMSINTFRSLLDLVKPIKLAKAGTLDPFYVFFDSPLHAEILGGFVKEPRFGDSDEVDAAKELARATGALDAAAQFPTQVFWLALRAMHVLFVPAIKEDHCFLAAAGYFQTKDMTKFDAAFGEHVAYETIVDSSSFLVDLAALLNLEMAFCLIAVFPHRAAEIVGDKLDDSVLTDQVVGQWAALPSCILEDLFDVLEYYIDMRPPPLSELFTHLNAKLLLFLVTFMLGSGNHLKNPNLRGKATTILMSLAKQRTYMDLLETSPVLASDIIPGCIRVFTAVEKTKQSYYDIRMQLKYQLRIPIMELIDKVLPLASHKASLKQFAMERSDEFLKFLNQMMNDATMQLEEGMDTLAEIRRLVREGGTAALERPNAAQVAEDEQTADGADVYRRSRADPKEHCKTYMKMGNRTIKTLWSISREAPIVIVGKLNVLQQLLHNCLNSNLTRLVGPRCLELKGQSKDFAEYNFDPKELLRMIAETYVYVAREDQDRVQKMIVEDGRSYKAKTFLKAVAILKREQIMAPQMLQDFEAFVDQLNQLACDQEAALANVTIPDNYLDPIMQEIMEDPVELPTSKTIMDRKVIERHIMSNDDDPFNRAHLSVTDLVPQDALRTEIQAFCAKHGIALGGED